MIHQTDYDAAGAGAPEAGRSFTSASPQPCWMTLDAARDQAFTGEIVFDAEPEVRVYLDNGVAYYAERADDDTLGRRLIDAGLIDAVQLERGMVRVGDVEHLGRLFDRDPTVDRDAVMVVTEDATESLLADLANNVIASSRSTAYRHHESGVHRWFVAPASGGHMTRPVSDVAPLDNSVVEDLPGLPSAETGSIGDELRIEWDLPITELTPAPVSDGVEDTFENDLLGMPLDGADIVDSPFGDRLPPEEPGPFAPPAVDRVEDEDQPDVTAPAVAAGAEHTVAAAAAELTAPDAPAAELEAGDPEPLAVDLDALLAPVDDLQDDQLDDRADEPGDADPPIAIGEPVADTEVIVPLDEDFLIVWPDGTEEAPIPPAADTADPVGGTDIAPIAGEVLLPGRPAEAAAEPEAPVEEIVEAQHPAAADAPESPIDDLADDPESPVDDLVDAVVETVADESVVDVPAVEPESVVDLADVPAVEPGSVDDLADESAVEPESVVDLVDESAVEATGESQPDASVVPEIVFDEMSDVRPVDPVESELAVDVVEARPVGEPEPSAEVAGEAVVAADPPEPQPADAAPADAPADEPHIDFEVPSLVLSDFPSAEGAVPDDVSSAVLRAIRAIENASTAAPHVAPIVGADTTTAPAPAPAPVEPAPAPMGFAPPTLETSAEVMYAAAAAAAAAAERQTAEPSADRSDTDAEAFEPRVASVVFVDDEEEPEPEDRAGALRRLIGSLRRR